MLFLSILIMMIIGNKDMTHETFTCGYNNALSALQYEVSPADAMVRLVEKYGLSKEDAFLCVCAAQTTLRQLEGSDTLPPSKG